MTRTYADDFRPRPNPQVTARDLRDEYILLGSTGDQMHMLNDTAREIFLLCDGTRTLEQIAAALRATYDITPEKARADVLRVIAELDEKGVLAAS
jgi:pyrroloquinoline quinone biosynthesis protein D